MVKLFMQTHHSSSLHAPILHLISIPITSYPLPLLHYLETICDPFHLLEREDFGDDFPRDEGEGDGSVFARITGFGEVVADEPTVPFGNLNQGGGE